MTRPWQLRAGPGALIILAHLVFFAILIRHAGTPSIRNEAPPADYISFALIPAAAEPKPAPAAAPTPSPAARKRRAARAQSARAPPAPLQAQAITAPLEEAPATANPQGKRLDMEALRADGRRLASSHVAGPFEQVRDAEARLEAGKKDLGRAISNARRPPCTKKYSGGTSLNVFALIPLAIDTITDTGCKW